MKRDQPKSVRCAIYTRKSSEEGLEQEFNSLHAQRETGEAFIKSQASEGWVCLPDHYDDGAFSGGNLKRPALQRLLRDIEAGKVDCLVVYKYDRLSRSMRDFFALLEILERKNVAFVAVTQQFNTATSAGRLMLNMLLSFAQFEREIVSERTRDKIALSRQKGKWAGGHPPLGYDIDRESKRLRVNQEEADRVRAMYRLYLEHERLMAVVRKLEQRGWHNKQWTNSKGEVLGGRPFDKASLRKLLLNDIYVARVRHKDVSYPGQHEAIIDDKTFRRVGELLKRNGQSGGTIVRNKHGALLRGLLHCSCCDRGMRYSYSSKPDGKRYAYYLCAAASTRGWQACPAPSVPAAAIEDAVISHLKQVANDPTLIDEIVQQVRPEAEALIKDMEAERQRVERDRKRLDANLKSAVAAGGPERTSRVADLNSRLAVANERLEGLAREVESLRCTLVTRAEVAAALQQFDALWAALQPHERVRIVQLMIRHIEWDGRDGTMRIHFHPTGLRGLVDRTNNLQQEAA